jgi:hypothetical protein
MLVTTPPVLVNETPGDYTRNLYGINLNQYRQMTGLQKTL